MVVHWGKPEGVQEPPKRVIAAIERLTEALCQCFMTGEQIDKTLGSGSVLWSSITSSLVSHMATVMANAPEAERDKIYKDYLGHLKVTVEAIEQMTPEQLEKMQKHGLSNKGLS